MKPPSHLALIALRHSTKHPVQSLLLILGVALGVAMIIAIDLANSSASQAFALSIESIAGKATHRIVAAPNGVPSSLYEKLRVEQGLRNIAPLVSGSILLPEADDLPLRLLGLDPFAEAPFRSYLSVGTPQNRLPIEALTTLLLEPNTLLLSQNLGNRLNLSPGDSFRVSTNGKVLTVRLAGLLQPNDDLSRRALDSLALTDIGTAQELLGQEGFLSHIDLILSPEDDLQFILDLLPDNVQLQRTNLRNETLDQLRAAFELNLFALSLLGVVVGMFLIYNTISFSVVQRRSVLGMLRCLGVTRREIFGLILTEAIVLSAIGTLIGLGLGILIGWSLINLVTQTINDLFFSLTVQDVSLQPLSIYKGIVAGLGGGLIAASLPALEATTTPPFHALKRSGAETRILSFIPWLSFSGLLLIASGGGLLRLSTQSLALSFLGLFMIVIGIAFLTPILTKYLMTCLAPFVQHSLGIIGAMALRNIIRSLSRTSVTIAALMVSISVIIGVSVMIASFRNTVIDWLETILVADIFIRPTGLSQSIDPAFIKEIRQREDITQIGLARASTVLAPAYGPVSLQAFSDSDIYGGTRDFLWTDGQPAQAKIALRRGDIFVSEVFARQHGLSLNQPSELVLRTEIGPHSFQIAGIFYDYAPQGFILMDRQIYQHFWQDDSISNIALHLQANLDADQIAETLQTQFAGPYQLNIISNRGVKQSAIIVFDRTFTITTALRLLAMLVAFIGVLSALMSLQLEKTKELGTLRAHGMTIRQLWSLTFIETGLIGLVAGLIAIPTGLIMAIILIYVINLRSFGWSLQLQMTPQIFLLALSVSIAASLLASIYPSIRLGKMKIATALREE